MAALRSLCPAAYRAVTPWLDRPLADYLAHLWETAGAGPAWLSGGGAGDATLGRELFCRQLAESMRDQGATPSAVDGVRRQLERVPIVQTADHLQLLLDPVMFANHVATMIGALRGGCEYVVVVATSMNSFKSRALSGPGFLAAGSGVLKVLGLTKRDRRGCVYAHRGPVRVALSPLGEPDRELERVAASLRQLVGPAGYGSAASAFRQANQRIWEHFGFHRRATLVQLDSTFVARLAARHLRLGHGEVFDLFFDRRVREAFLAARRASERDPMVRGFLRHQTDLVWGVAKGRLVPLSLRDGVLRDEFGHVAVPFEPERVAAGLAAGRLAPDLCVTYLVQNILPALSTLGGPSQLVHVPLLWRLFRPPQGQLGATALIQGVLEVDPPPVDLAGRSPDENARWLAGLGTRTVAESMGSMRAISYLVGLAVQI
jgi:hypothetical protein